MSDKPHIIIDIGSDFIKAGFSGEDGPRSVFRNLIGRPKMPGLIIGSDQRDYFVGPEAEEKRGILVIKSPVERGVVEDWDDLEKVLDFTFTNELRVNPEEHCVLITAAALMPKAHREKLTQIMFDTFSVEGFSIVSTSVCALSAYGKPTGVSVESGDGVTYIVPVFDGYALPHSTLRINLSGQDITDHLAKLLSESGHHMTTSAEKETVKDIKEKTCYVALDFDQALSQSKQSTSGAASYQMPNGTGLQLHSERFRSAEALFKPSLLGREYGGLHEQVHQSIMKSDTEIRRELFANIVVSGGNSLFPGLPERLSCELKKLAPAKLAAGIHVSSVPEAKYSAWIGASILSSAADFTPRWINREEYQNTGASIVHQKCL